MSLRTEIARIEGPNRFLPHTLTDALAWMDVVWRSMRKDLTHAGPYELHHGFGQYLRNALGLWHGSPLASHMKSRGIEHPDDMSMDLLQRYIRWLKKNPNHPRPWEDGYTPPTLED